jgi:hypothetical protein
MAEAFAYAGHSARELAEALVDEAVTLCAGDQRIADQVAGQLLGGGFGNLTTDAIGAAMQRRLRQVVQRAVRAGWGPRDLTELIRRRLSPLHQPLLLAVLHDETAGFPADRVSPEWRAELRAAEPTRSHPLTAQAGLAVALGLAAALDDAPPIPRLTAAPGEADPLDNVQVEAGGRDAKVLARVRALLAKAESTEFEEEANSLSAKAQELISRYSLDRLVAAQAAPGAAAAAVLARRIWLDPPYLSAKASLVAAVAAPNRCSAVSAEKLGFTTVVGIARDLDAVEVLTTSLMVQASTAMLAAGRGTDRFDESRTPSYRRSFLLAYAHRIGERLAAADDAVTTLMGGSGGGAALVPVLKDHGARVEAALAAMFPSVVYRTTRAGNRAGWAEGRAAADQARLRPSRAVER